MLLLTTLTACAAKHPEGGVDCSRAGVDIPGATRMRDGGDAGVVDAAVARAIGESVASDVLRGLEAKHRAERPNLSLALIDFDVQPRDPGAVDGCITYSYFYVYRQPTGRELGAGESHFDVFVAEDGKAWVVWDK